MIYLFGYETYQPVNMVMGNIFREHFARFRGLDPNCSPFFNLDLATYHNQSETNYDEFGFLPFRSFPMERLVIVNIFTSNLQMALYCLIKGPILMELWHYRCYYIAVIKGARTSFQSFRLKIQKKDRKSCHRNVRDT